MEEKRFWDLYVTKYAWMDEKSYIPFEKFFVKPKPINVTKKSRHEILEKVSRIKTKLDERGN